MESAAAFRVGISFHTFVQDYISFVYSFEDMMEMASVLGRGVEIVGPSNHRGFPEVTDEFERTFKSGVDRYGLIPTCYGSYSDPFMLPDRDLTPAEMYEYLVPQLKGAAKLGFPVVRLQYFSHVIAEKLVALAEKLDLKLGYELHTPLTLESDTVAMLREQIERIGSNRLGLIPDFGIFARSISQHHLDQGRRAGVGEDLIALAQELWATGTSKHDAVEAVQEAGGDERAVSWVNMLWGCFGRSDPAKLVEIRDHIVHCHGKFYSIVDGDEPDLRYEEVVKVLVDIGYTGWVSTEYEGGPTDTFTIAMAHQEMMNRYIRKYAQK